MSKWNIRRRERSRSGGKDMKMKSKRKGKSSPLKKSVMQEKSAAPDMMLSEIITEADVITEVNDEIALETGEAGEGDADNTGADDLVEEEVAEDGEIIVDSSKGMALQAEDIDYTKIPTELNQKFEELDEDAALRATIIKLGNVWTKKTQEALLAPMTTSTLNKNQQKLEQNKAFDLLDSLSRSGSLQCEYASLHVVIASTHCFDKNLMDSVIQDNINPIEKLERSELIVATTVHRESAEELIKVSQKVRVENLLSSTLPE